MSAEAHDADKVRRARIQLARARGQDWKMRLARAYRDFPALKSHGSRLTMELFELRAAGVDIGAACRSAEALCAVAGVDVDVPVDPAAVRS